jgi:hypothetical protein
VPLYIPIIVADFARDDTLEEMITERKFKLLIYTNTPFFIDTENEGYFFIHSCKVEVAIANRELNCSWF